MTTIANKGRIKRLGTKKEKSAKLLVMRFAY
jgi:hypothetical protein